ncbi:MAG: hypothetical protein WC876_09430 [Candidatus Thermoplasmatota archaeon]
MARDTVRAEVAVDAWTSFVKAALGALGLAMLAVGPLVPRDSAFHYLPQYTFVVGGGLVIVAATMRLRSMLIVLGCVALTAGLACTLVGKGNPDLNLAALALYSAAAVILGAAGRHAWMAVPFMLVPLLIVAPQGDAGWAQSREAFAESWEAAVGCPCLLAGLPAGLAVVGAVIGQLSSTKWAPVKPSAVSVLAVAGGLVLASLIVGTLAPPQFTFLATVSMRVALLSGVLGWVALSYQVGRVAFAWQAALACLLFLIGALFLDRATQFPAAVGPTLGITIATSLVPAALAGMGLMVRKWIGKERPATPQATAALKTWSEAEQRSFFTAATTAPYDPGTEAIPLAKEPAPATPPSKPGSPPGT